MRSWTECGGVGPTPSVALPEMRSVYKLSLSNGPIMSVMVFSNATHSLLGWGLGLAQSEDIHSVYAE